MGRVDDPLPSGPTNVHRLAALDAESLRVRFWDYFVIPGPLQTAEYSAALIRGADPTASRYDVDHRVAVKQSRARAFLSRERMIGTRIAWVVIGEHAITHAVSNDWNMHVRQLQHLLAVCDHDRIELGIVPEVASAIGQHPSFALYDLSDDTRVGYVESILGSFYSWREEYTRKMHVAFNDLRRIAVSPEGAQEMIRGVLESWQELGQASTDSTRGDSLSSRPTRPAAGSASA